MLAPIQADYQKSREWQDITLKAYPPPEVKKKEKKVKDKGSRHPRGAPPPKEPLLEPRTEEAEQIETQPDGSVEGPKKNEVNLATGVEEAIEALIVNKVDGER